MHHVLAEVSLRGADTAASFDRAIDGLHGVRGSLSQLTQRLAELAPLLQSEVGSDAVVANVAAAGESLAAALLQAADAAYPPDCHAASNEAKRALERIESLARHLRAVSSLTLVTARSLGSPHFDIYCEGLRAMVAAMEEAGATLFSAVDAVVDARQETQTLCQSASARLRDRLEVISRHSVERQRLHRQLSQFIDEVASHVRDLPAVMQRDMAVLVTALQFSDSFSQRLDHIRTILDHADDLGAAALSLAAAQLTALCDDASSVLLPSLQALDQLGMAAQKVAGSIGTRHSDGGLEMAFRSIRSTREVLATVIESEAEAQNAACMAAQQIHLIRTKTTEMEERFVGLRGTTIQIDLAAINSTLLAMRSAGMHKALGVLSKDVRGIANDCAADSALCSQAIQILSNEDGLISQDTLSDAAADFGKTLGQGNQTLAQAEQAIKSLAELRKKVEVAAHDAWEATAQSMQAVSAAGQAAQALRQLAANLPFDSIALQNGAETLAQFMAIYTMEREREVHLLATVSPANRTVQAERPESTPQPPVTTNAVAEDDLLASILF